MSEDNGNPFNIAGGKEAAPQYGMGFEENTTPTQAQEMIKTFVESNDIFIFMKGTPQFPQCGFSANTIGIFNHLGKKFQTFDVLSNPAVRQGIKDFSNWPTIPQIYVQGKFIGGNDIVTEMYESGDLQELLKELA